MAEVLGKEQGRREGGSKISRANRRVPPREQPHRWNSMQDSTDLDTKGFAKHSASVIPRVLPDDFVHFGPNQQHANSLAPSHGSIHDTANIRQPRQIKHTKSAEMFRNIQDQDNALHSHSIGTAPARMGSIAAHSSIRRHKSGSMRLTLRKMFTRHADTGPSPPSTSYSTPGQAVSPLNCPLRSSY
jgi:hypothetical protein